MNSLCQFPGQATVTGEATLTIYLGRREHVNHMTESLTQPVSGISLTGDCLNPHGVQSLIPECLGLCSPPTPYLISPGLSSLSEDPACFFPSTSSTLVFGLSFWSYCLTHLGPDDSAYTSPGPGGSPALWERFKDPEWILLVSFSMGMASYTQEHLMDLGSVGLPNL